MVLPEDGETVAPPQQDIWETSEELRQMVGNLMQRGVRAIPVRSGQCGRRFRSGDSDWRSTSGPRFCCTPAWREGCRRALEYSKTLVYLVHGMWGRGLFRVGPGKEPRWFEKNSAFFRQLTAKLGGESSSLEVVPFNWSGANSLVDRYEAAAELASRIEKDLPPLVRTRVIILGHSHGGNIALMASHMLRGSPGRGAVSVDVVTLATPFVRLVPAQATRRSENGPTILGVTVAAHLVVFHLWHLEPVRHAVSYLCMTLPKALLGPTLLLSFTLLALLVDLACVPFIGLPRSGSSIAGTRLQRYAVRRRDRLLAHCPQTPVGEGSRLLVVRGFNDEANMALVAGSIGNWLSSWVHCIGGVTVIQLMAPRKWPLFLLAAAALLLGPMLDWVELVPWHLAAPILGEPVVTAFCLMLAAGPLKCVYGREMFFWSNLVEVSADSVPDVSGAVDVVTLLPIFQQDDPLLRKWRTRHSIHESKVCVDALVDWILMGSVANSRCDWNEV